MFGCCFFSEFYFFIIMLFLLSWLYLIWKKVCLSLVYNERNKNYRKSLYKRVEVLVRNSGLIVIFLIKISFYVYGVNFCLCNFFFVVIFLLSCILKKECYFVDLIRVVIECYLSVCLVSYFMIYIVFFE